MEPKAEKVMRSEFKGLFCRSLDYENAERNAGNGDLVCADSVGSLRVPKDSIRTVCMIALILWVWSAGAEESVVINKRPAPLT